MIEKLSRKKQFCLFLIQLIETFKVVHEKEAKIVAELESVVLKTRVVKNEIRKLISAFDILKGLKLIESSISDTRKLIDKRQATDTDQIDYNLAKLEVT